MAAERISLDVVEFPRPPAGFWRRLWAVFASWRRTAEQRNVLAQFDARMLRDLGLTEADVWLETRLPPWRMGR